MGFHLQRSFARRILGVALLPAALALAALAAAPAAADSGDPTPPPWDDKTYTWPEDEMPVDFPEGGGGPALSLLFIDVEPLNEAVTEAGAGWSVPTFDTDQPMLLWGGGGGGGFNSVRFGGFGAGGDLTVDDSEGTSQFSLGYGGARVQYVIRPGGGRSETYPGGRLRFTLGGLVGGGGYELKLTDKEGAPIQDATRDYPVYRSASQGFVLLAPEVGIEFSLTRVTHLAVSASYLYPIPVGSSNADADILPDSAVIQNVSVTVALMFGLF